MTTSALRTPAPHTTPTKDLRRAPDSAVSRVEELPAGSALLVVKRGPNAGSRFLLDQPVTAVGRQPDSDIFLDDVTVSRRHAEFRWENDEFQVVDLGSLNGTYVNRKAVDSAVLVNGDEVQIGRFRLVFLTGPKNDGDPGRTWYPVTALDTPAGRIDVPSDRLASQRPQSLRTPRDCQEVPDDDPRDFRFGHDAEGKEPLCRGRIHP